MQALYRLSYGPESRTSAVATSGLVTAPSFAVMPYFEIFIAFRMGGVWTVLR